MRTLASWNTGKWLADLIRSHFSWHFLILSTIRGWIDYWIKAALKKLTYTTTCLCKWDMFHWLTGNIKLNQAKEKGELNSNLISTSNQTAQTKTGETYKCFQACGELYGLRKPTEVWDCKNMSDRIFFLVLSPCCWLNCKPKQICHRPLHLPMHTVCISCACVRVGSQ